MESIAVGITHMRKHISVTASSFIKDESCESAHSRCWSWPFESSLPERQHCSAKEFHRHAT